MNNQFMIVPITDERADESEQDSESDKGAEICFCKIDKLIE